MTYLSIKLDTGIFQLSHQLSNKLLLISVERKLTFVAASLKSLSKLNLTTSILLGTFVVSNPAHQLLISIYHPVIERMDIPLFFMTSPTFNMASTAP